MIERGDQGSGRAGNFFCTTWFSSTRASDFASRKQNEYICIYLGDLLGAGSRAVKPFLLADSLRKNQNSHEKLDGRKGIQQGGGGCHSRE